MPAWLDPLLASIYPEGWPLLVLVLPCMPLDAAVGRTALLRTAMQ